MSTASNVNLIGGLDFSSLIDAVGTVVTALQGVVTRLQNVAPQAGSTDAASSAAAQQEIQTLADQLNGAVSQLNAINQTAQTAASNVAGGQQPPVSNPAPTDTTSGASAATPATPVPATPVAPETGGNVPPVPTPSGS